MTKKEVIMKTIGFNCHPANRNFAANLSGRILAMALLALALAFMTPVTASASYNYPPEAWDFANSSFNFTSGTWSFGNVFTVGSSPVTVTALGYYHGGGPWTDTHDVGLFDTSGNLVISSTLVEGGGCTDIGHFCFNAIAPITLLPTQSYLIVGYSGIDPYTWNDPGFDWDPRITYIGNNWVASGSLTFTGFGLINDTTDGYWGPNFLMSGSTPEPGSLLLFGSGIAGLGGLLRRRLLG